MLDEVGSPGTVAIGGPRYFGFVNGGALPIAQAAAWLGAAWDQNVGLPVMSPAAARLNAVALRWVTELLGLPGSAWGGFVTGATIAAVQNEGTCWCGPTTWRGRRAMRISVSCWNTTEADIDRSIAAVLGCAPGRPGAGYAGP
jgi:glutamate/tyrosine decarboxylase-like PLP-dependent enzyme